MNCFHFGEPAKQLFGAYHAAHPSRDRREGLVLCNPIGQEYMRAHRAILELANRLSGCGFHVLRFDYFATGDSHGASIDGSISQWTGDIAAAVEELRDYAGISRISLAGMRLGATLAAIAAENLAIEKLALWDVVINGKQYLSEVIDMHDAWLKDLLHRPPPEIRHSENLQVLGFPFSASFCREIEQIDLMQRHNPSAKKTLIINNAKRSEIDALQKHFENNGALCQAEMITGARVWRKESGYPSVLMPNEALNTIVEWLQKDDK